KGVHAQDGITLARQPVRHLAECGAQAADIGPDQNGGMFAFPWRCKIGVNGAVRRGDRHIASHYADSGAGGRWKYRGKRPRAHQRAEGTPPYREPGSVKVGLGDLVAHRVSPSSLWGKGAKNS